MTKKLYDTDSYLSVFDCTVLSVSKKDCGYDVITDRTAFFPEAGGQTCDKGTLGAYTVNHVRLEGDTVVHEIHSDTKPFCVGDNLSGVIDMDKRFSDMQQHTGEHILSGIAHRLYGCDNTGFHLGSELVTLDFNVVLSSEQIADLETRANRAVFENHTISVSFPTDDELSVLPYRSKKELDGAIRIVTIEGVDVCACCAPHVKMTGEVGLIRIVSYENYKGGVRIYILCGQRGLSDIQQKLSQNKEIGTLLSAKEHETSSYVKRLMSENDKLKRELYLLRMSGLKSKADSYKNANRIIVVEDNDEPELIRELAVLLKDKVSELSAVLGCLDGKVTRYVICTPGKDANTVGRAFNAEFHGRGGGRNEMVQGTVNGNPDILTDFLNNFIL